MSRPLTRHCLIGATLLVSLSGVVSAQTPRKKAPARLTGEQVYRQQCAGCHGAKGEGGKAFPRPLVGTRSPGELAKFIAQTMPPGPKKTPPAQAKLAAEYIHGAFYSPLAQERNRPARVELSRLTVRQYRSALADLVGSFRRGPVPDERRGLRGEYYRSRGFRRDQRALERVDPQVSFDFGIEPPAPEMDPKQFSIRWEGSVLAPESGEYEFIVRTEHATRFWINNLQEPLIDAWVKSGNDKEYRASIFLLGGRSYPLRLEFSKSNQGVNNPEKQAQTPASLALLWRQPKRSAEVVPNRCLSPVTVTETFVPATPFPPDDRSIGYERGTSVSKEWDEATTEGAIETANHVAARLDPLTGSTSTAPDRDQRLRAFCREFASRAFRRPLAPELEEFFITRVFREAPDADTAAKRVVLLVLKSPRFLFREVSSSQPDAYDVAARLSFGLWDSLPDPDLLKAAAAGQLSTREQVAAQADRMANDPRARSKVLDFFLQWLKVDHHPDLAKDGKKYPGFDDAVASDLRTSLELGVEHAVWSEKSDFRELMLSDQVFLNGRLAKLYGVNLPADAPFQPVKLESAERAGLLTHPYILSSFAYLDATSPIHRGVLIARSLLGRVLLPPPVAVSPVAADLHPNLTTRQRVDLQTKPDGCRSCHDMINPLGFTLERFDAIGRLRTADNGKPVDASGAYQARSGEVVRFQGVRDLARFIATSDEAHGAFAEQLFQYVVKQPVLAYGPRTLPDLQKAFATNQFSIRKQLVETVTVAALHR